MAQGKLSATDRPTDKLLNKIADFIDADSVKDIAMDLNMRDAKLSQIMAENTGTVKYQAFRVFKWWDEGSTPPDIQTLIGKLREWKRSGYVDIDVMDDIQDMVDMDLQTSQSNKILTNKHLGELAGRITGEMELMDVGVQMLGLPERKVHQALTNHPQRIQAASHEVLRHWLRQQVNREEAYHTMYRALSDNKWRMLATELKTWVEG